MHRLEIDFVFRCHAIVVSRHPEGEEDLAAGDDSHGEKNPGQAMRSGKKPSNLWSGPFRRADICRYDVASACAIDFFALIGVHFYNAAETLPLAGALVDHLVALLHRALVDTHECELTVWIVHKLERHANELLRGIGFQRDFFFRIAPILGRHFVCQGRRQVANHGVQQRLHTFVLVGSAHEDRGGVLVLHGADDKFESPEQIADFQKEMRDAKVDWQFVSFGGAVHCFAIPDAHGQVPGCEYNERASKRGFAMMRDFLNETFAP